MIINLLICKAYLNFIYYIRFVYNKYIKRDNKFQEEEEEEKKNTMFDKEKQIYRGFDVVHFVLYFIFYFIFVFMRMERRILYLFLARSILILCCFI